MAHLCIQNQSQEWPNCALSSLTKPRLLISAIVFASRIGGSLSVR